MRSSKAPDRLVLIMEENLESGFPEFTVSPPNFKDFHDRFLSHGSIPVTLIADSMREAHYQDT